jgi:hypothetical protein
MTTRVFCMVALLTLSATASAEVYRWVDGQGRVHYSDRPAENSQLVSVRSRPSSPEAIAERTGQEAEQRAQSAARETEQRNEQATANAVQKDVNASREEQCKKAQEAYKTAVESQRLYREGKNGEREYLTDAEITEARVNGRKAVDQLCKPAG